MIALEGLEYTKKYSFRKDFVYKCDPSHLEDVLKGPDY